MKYPLISIAIPTLNEEDNIVDCLVSIYSQNYPKNCLEIFIVDGGSTDKTLEVIKEYKFKYIFNKEKDAQIGKKLALEKATGSFFIYLDADVRLRGKDWFKKMLKPLLENNEIVASFSRYYSRPNDSWITRFLYYDPIGRDPIYEFFSPSVDKSIKGKKDRYYLCNFSKDCIPPEGRCLYRTEVLKRSLIFRRKKFMELDNLSILVSEGNNQFAYVPSAGFYHNFILDLRHLVKKRIRNIRKNYLFQEEGRYYTWFDLKKPKDLLKVFAWIIYVYLFIPGLIRGIYKAVKYKDIICLIEPFLNFIETNVIIFTFIWYTPKKFFKK